MVTGLAGVALVVGVESVQTLGQLLGALAMLGAAASYALSSFVVKRRYGHMAAMQTSLASIAVAAVLTLPLALATLPSAMPGARALLSVLVLGSVGTALAFVIFYKLINEVGAGRASLVSYLAPGVALFYGALLLDEPITVAAIAGLALILGGVAIAARKRRVSPSGTAGPLAASPRRPRPGRLLRRAA
jgi:drug/metabolite transporter (DMT)-like permease